MIITRTPFRVSLAGGGTDLPEYYMRFGGAVMSLTINKYTFLSMHPRPFGEKDFLLKYSKNEHVRDRNDIEHQIIKTILTDYNLEGVDLNSSADVPQGSGLGSSSAFTVGLTHLCNAYTYRSMTKEQMAEYACDVEIHKLGSPIGKQDQYACAVGGLNYITFNQHGHVTIDKIVMDPVKYTQLQKNLLLFFTGTTRSANDILKQQRTRTIEDEQTVSRLHSIKALASKARDALANGDLGTIGYILHTNWEQKKRLQGSISNQLIDDYYHKAMSAGAVGGKILGAGGGGFLLFYVEEKWQDKVRQSLSNLYELRYQFENTGTTIIYYS